MKLTHNPGTKPIVIGEVDDKGNTIRKITIGPGEPIPKKWQRLISSETLFIGHRGGRVGNPKEVKQAFKKFEKIKKEAN